MRILRISLYFSINISRMTLKIHFRRDRPKKSLKSITLLKDRSYLQKFRIKSIKTVISQLKTLFYGTTTPSFLFEYFHTANQAVVQLVVEEPNVKDWNQLRAECRKRKRSISESLIDGAHTEQLKQKSLEGFFHFPVPFPFNNVPRGSAFPLQVDTVFPQVGSNIPTALPPCNKL